MYRPLATNIPPAAQKLAIDQLWQKAQNMDSRLNELENESNRPILSVKVDTNDYLTRSDLLTFKHNDLSGLTLGDPHTQYLKIDGSRALTADWDASLSYKQSIGWLGVNTLTTAMTRPGLNGGAADTVRHKVVGDSYFLGSDGNVLTVDSVADSGSILEIRNSYSYLNPGVLGKIMFTGVDNAVGNNLMDWGEIECKALTNAGGLFYGAMYLRVRRTSGGPYTWLYHYKDGSNERSVFNYDVVVTGDTTLKATLSGIATLTSGLVGTTPDNHTNWDTAYGWGNHASGGYFVGTAGTIRALFSETATGLSYDNSTGVLSLTTNYIIPTTTQETNWNSAYSLSHAKQHNLLTVADHGDVATYLNQALLTSSTPTFANVIVPTAGYVGLDAAKGRIVFTDAATDTITVLTCFVGIGSATTPTNLLSVSTSDAGTNAVVYPISAVHESSGTAEAGYGVGINFRNQRFDTGAAINCGSIEVYQTAEAISAMKLRPAYGNNVLVDGLLLSAISDAQVNARFYGLIGIGIAPTEPLHLAGDYFLHQFADDGATGPIHKMYHLSASPAANDIIAQHTYFGKDSAGNVENYGAIACTILDPTSTSEDSSISFNTMIAGTLAERVNLADVFAVSPASRFASPVYCLADYGTTIGRGKIFFGTRANGAAYNTAMSIEWGSLQLSSNGGKNELQMSATDGAGTPATLTWDQDSKLANIVTLVATTGNITTVNATSVNATGAIKLTEMTDPGNSPANTAYLFAVDATGKTAIYAHFPSGAVVPIAVEP